MKTKEHIEANRKKWVMANKDKIREMSRRYYLKAKQSPEYLKKKHEWYLTQADKISIANKEERAEYRKLHPIVRKTVEEKKANERAWREANKDVLSANRKKWAAENKEKLRAYYKEYNKRWYAQNKEERREQLRDYSKAHPKENVLRTQKYVQRFPQKVKDYNKQFNQTLVGKYRYTLTRSKRWNTAPISIEEFGNLILLPCVYCGENEQNRGIDRVDNLIGYTKENSAPCCKNCNYMKKNHSVQDFLTHITKIYKHNGN